MKTSLTTFSPELLGAALDAVPSEMALIRLGGDIVAVNRKWCDFADAGGYRGRDYAVGTNYLTVCDTAVGPGSEFAAPVATGIRAVAAAGDGRAEFAFEYPCHPPDGSRHAWKQVRVRRCEAPGFCGLAVVHEDVTPAREAAEVAGKMLDRVRLELDEARRIARAKDEFLAMLSHELRTPLNAVLGWVQMLRRGLVGPADMPGVLEVIEGGTRAQARLIGDLLDLSRMAVGKLDIRPEAVRPADAVRAAVEGAAMTAREKGVRLETDLGADVGLVRADPARLQQVVWNLLTNAIKFTPAGGSVSVRTSGGNGTARIAVADTGKGIAPEALDKIFDQFWQADPSCVREHGGLGLGLAIVKRIVDLHGGRVWAESEGPGRGATLSVELPTLDPRPA
jgi:signal transduction histidine kinase